MKKILLIQPLLPRYSIDFIVALNKKLLQHNMSLSIACDVKIKTILNNYKPELIDNDILHAKQIIIGPFIFRSGLSIGMLKSFDLVIFNANPRDVTQLYYQILLKVFGKNTKFVSWGMFHRIGRFKLSTLIYFKIVSMLSAQLWTYTRIGASNLISIGVPKSIINIIGTAIDDIKIEDAKKNLQYQDVRNFKDRYSLTDIVILQVVRLSEYKKPRLIIEAAKILKKKGVVCNFLIVGGGDLYNEISELISNYDLADYVKMLGPVYEESQLAVIYSCSKIFVIPTCIGLSAHHAFSYGLPIITDNSLDSQGSEFDILANGLNCMLYDEGDVHSLANTIEKLIDDNELLTRLSDCAHHTVCNIHSLDRKVNTFLKSIRAIVNE
ncbi:glycosyltransferase [Shewanella sp.]|uniref:glycosyltransferase n=1 Tax=Shewanella sp. TaxID=50422 RepID=UPI0040485B54